MWSTAMTSTSAVMPCCTQKSSTCWVSATLPINEPATLTRRSETIQEVDCLGAAALEHTDCDEGAVVTQIFLWRAVNRLDRQRVRGLGHHAALRHLGRQRAACRVVLGVQVVERVVQGRHGWLPRRRVLLRRPAPGYRTPGLVVTCRRTITRSGDRHLQFSAIHQTLWQRQPEDGRCGTGYSGARLALHVVMSS